MPVVLVTHPRDRLKTYFGDTALARLRAMADVRLNPGEEDLSGPALVAAAQGCDLLIAYRQTALGADVVAALPARLQAVLRCAVDIRTIDVGAASEQGILVTQASAGFMASVSEWIVGAMVDLSRGLSTAVAAYRAGEAPPPVMGRELRGAKLGVIGYGQISRYLCPVAQALGMRVMVYDPQLPALTPGLHAASLPELLAVADHVVCLAPFTPATENLMNADAFASMKPGSYFINAARGELVDDAALLAALDSGHLAGAALDVGRAADQMPTASLAAHARVVATPHIGGLTPAAIEHQALETVAQAQAVLQGRCPIGSVNPEFARRLRGEASHAPA